MFGLTEKVTGIIGGVMALALLLTAAWATRVDHLRAKHLETVEAVRDQLEAAGFKPVTAPRMAADVQFLATSSRTNRASLDAALSAIDDMSAAIQKLRDEGVARQAGASKAMEAAQRASEKAKSAASDLEASAMQSSPDGACSPSDAYSSAKDQL